MLESTEVVHRRDATGGEDWKLTLLGQVLEQGEIRGRVLFTVDMDRSDEQAAQGNASQFLREIENVDWHAANPATCDDAPLANIGCDDEESREQVRDICQPLGFVKRPPAENDSRRARVGEAFDLLERLHSSANLNLDRSITNDVVHHTVVRSRSEFRIAVNDLQAAKPVRGQRAGDANRVTSGEIGGLTSWSSRLDTRAIPEIDGRYHDHN